MQKHKYGPAAKQYLFLFLGRPKARTNVSDIFIQPYTLNRKGMHWIRLKKLVCLPFFIWMDGDHNQENVVQKPCFFDKLQDSQFFSAHSLRICKVISIFMD